MALKRCDNGHYYDPAKHTSCPSCGIDAHGEGKTMPKRETAPPAPAASDDKKTVAVVRKQAGIDPVVGWLVCVEGADRGRDYRIHSERNFIGRGEGMDIRIAGDDTISRERHAILSFNPKELQFKVLPGEGRGIVYCNEEEVDGPRVLRAGDQIELGQTRLLFVPLCGKDFNWD